MPTRLTARPLAAFCALAVIGTAGIRSAAAAPAGEAVHRKQEICRAVDDAAAANRLPPAFLTRVLWVESRFRSDALSPKGAEGIAQFMPTTAAERGLADPREPIAAIGEAARLLSDLAGRFGNLGLAAAAYNAGAGRIDGWLHARGELPAETRRYVLAVTGRAAEDWAHPPGTSQAGGADTMACLQAMAEIGKLAPLGTAWAGGGSTRLTRLLARATALLHSAALR
ncbi:MAG TPA: transglycosylase SLT domain-containing protein [Stellaceae bacterium]|nr:transglycosylase SLT domain-containing protein [Stellaceae bacterium]